VQDKVAATIRTDSPELGADLPPLLALLDMPIDDPPWGRLDARQRHQRMLDAVKRLVLAASRRQPLLLVIEDLHWVDAATQAVLDTLVESLPAARVLLVVTYRPEYRHGWGSKTYYSQVRIDPLAPDGADTVLRRLLGSDPSLHPVVQRLHEQAGGNPFFLEETVRALVETRALIGERGAYRLAHAPDTIRLPSTVEAVLAARIERLPADERELLRWAAVIGTTVPAELLRVAVAWPEATIQRALSRLTAAELLYETRVVPDATYTFKHALTHQAAYDSLPQEERRPVHARVVEAIERTYRDRLAEHVEELAHHALRGELRDKAVDYLRRAGQKAAARSALVEARSWFEQALDRLEDAQRLANRAVEFLPPRSGFAIHAWHLLGDIATHPDRLDAERGEKHYRQALTLAEPSGMRPLVAHCHLGLGKLYRRAGEGSTARAHLATAVTMYREMDMGFWLEKAEGALACSGDASRFPR
jgi:predicted ATPase